MKLTIECRYPNCNWGNFHHNVSDCATFGGAVIVTLDSAKPVKLTTTEFERISIMAMLRVYEELKPTCDENGNIDSVALQENDAIINKAFIACLDSEYNILNIAYKLNNNH